MTTRDITRPIFVVGSVNSDLRLQVERLPMPGETVFARSAVSTFGGKGANQAVAAARLGASVHLLGAVGADEAGHMLRGDLTRNGVHTDLLEVLDGGVSGRAIVTVDAHGENQIIVERGANAELDPSSVADSLEMLSRTAESPIVLTQGEIGPEVVERVAAHCVQNRLRFVLNLAPVVDLSSAALKGASPLIVNEHELLELAGRHGLGRSDGDVVAVAEKMAEVFGDIVVTLGAGGALLWDAEGEFLVPVSRRVRPVDTTGAGDAFVGAFVTAIAQGRSLRDATAWGVACGTWSVGMAGTVASYPSREELMDSLAATVAGSHS